MKIKQKDFLKLVGSFNIIRSLETYEESVTDENETVREARSKNLQEERNKHINSFKILWRSLTNEQQKAIDDLIEFEAKGYECKTFSEFVNMIKQ